MTEIAPRIVVDARTQGGKPVIKGTRVPVEVILGVLDAGDSVEKIMHEYRLERADVLAALSYAASLVSGEEIREVG